MVNFCAVFGCSSKHRTGSGISFHRFPDVRKKPGLWKKWVRALARQNWTPSHYTYICSQHFEKSCFQMIKPGGRALLHKYAVPTIFNNVPRLPQSQGLRQEISMMLTHNYYERDSQFTLLKFKMEKPVGTQSMIYDIITQCKCPQIFCCYKHIEDHVKYKIFTNFHKLSSWKQQNSYLCELMKKKACKGQCLQKRKDPNFSRRTCTWEYFLNIDGKLIRVCSKAFRFVHGISDKRVRKAQGDSQNSQSSKQTCRFSTHFVGGNGPTRDHPDPLPVRPMNVLHSSAGYVDAGPSNQVFSGKPENPRRKKIAAATVSSATVLIPDDSPPQPSPAKVQKKQIDDRRFEEQRFQEQQRFQERRFDARRFEERRQMVSAQVSQMAAAKALQAQMPIQQHMNVSQASQIISRPVQVLPPPVQISEPKPKPVEKPRPREKRIFVVSDHQRCVMSNLASLWKSGKLCDAGIGNGSSTVMVHKVVLSAVCPKLLSVFSTDILSHKFLQVNFPEEVSTEALNAFAEYMYNGLLDIDPDILHQLKIIAKRLDMKEFEQLCDSRLPSTVAHIPTSTVTTVFGDLTQMRNNLSVPASITVPTIQPSLPSSSSVSVTSQSAAAAAATSITTQVIDVKQEISEAELAQVKKDTAAVFGQESEVASLDVSKSGNSSGGFVIVPSVKTEPVGPEDDRYGQQNNQSYASSAPSISRTSGPSLNSTVVSTSDFILPFSNTTDSSNTSTNVLPGTSKLKSNVFESSLVSDLSPVSCIVEKMCSQSSPIHEDPSKPLNRTLPTQSLDNIATSGASVYPIGLFTAGGDSLPLTSSQVSNVKNIALYKTDDLT